MSNNMIALKQGKKDETQSSGGGSRKTSSVKPPEQTLKCPRCDSNNTKFCYYNNYNLTQPRHFCKTCRRYWTKGGALRNIPVGGGCRKNKKSKSKSKFVTGDSSLHGLPPPVMDFQLGGLNQFSSSTSSNNILPFMNLDPLGFTFTKQEVHHINQSGGGFANFQEMGFTSSVESLSCLNQDLHWRLQQQQQKETGLQPMLFQNLEFIKPTPSSIGGESRKDGGSCGGLATEWFFDNNYAPVNLNPNTAMNQGNDQNGNVNNWNVVQAWNHMNQYGVFP